MSIINKPKETHTWPNAPERTHEGFYRFMKKQYEEDLNMASKKISYNDLKKQNDNNQLAQAFSAGKTVVSQRSEALIYAHELQLLRRNFEPYQILDAMAKLDQLKNPGKKTDGEAFRKAQSVHVPVQYLEGTKKETLSVIKELSSDIEK